MMLTDANMQFHLQPLNLAEDELAPDWYEPEAKSKKRKASTALTKELEKKKKVASIAVDEENEMLGTAVPTRR